MKSWLKKHKACDKGYEWALNNCKSMQEVWDKVQNPDWFLWVASRQGVVSVGDGKTIARHALDRVCLGTQRYDLSSGCWADYAKWEYNRNDVVNWISVLIFCRGYIRQTCSNGVEKADKEKADMCNWIRNNIVPEF